MHPIASVLQHYNNTDVDNLQFLARIVPQNALPKSHKFYDSKSTIAMLHYYPNVMAPDMKECYDFLNKCIIPSNCVHTIPIYGENLPQDVMDRHNMFPYTSENFPIRRLGRYVIVTYMLKNN